MHEDAKSTVHKEQSGNVSSKAGTACKSKMKKRRNRRIGKRRTRWKHSEMRSKKWRRSWNEE